MFRKLEKWHLLIVFAGLFACKPSVPEEVSQASENIPEEIDFNLHVKPILSDRCFACHGPDANKRKANLRLDTEEGAFAALGEEKNRFAIKAGNLKKSEMFHRILSDDPDLMMPPPESNLTLTDEEKATLVRWIDQGAEWKPHWAFITPEKPKLPEVKNEEWPANEIDHFVLKKLENKKFTPAPQADKRTLVRRLYFDLTGLPPSPDQVDEFVNDNSPDAYEKLVDELLQTPAHAERLAMEWMDVARYADSHGYHADGYREMWPWRDWVISAFAKNMPYDKFISWQIAGDLLPDPSREQLVATAFHRNHPMTAEGGIVDEEYRVEYVLDRVNTTAKAFLGLTMECSRCHDHKYDPISQKEYYQFSAFFNNVDELGMTGDDGNAGPMLKLTNEVTQHRLDSLYTMIEQIDKQKEVLAGNVKDNQIKITKVNTKNGLLAHYPLNSKREKTANLQNPGKPGKIVGEADEVEGMQGTAIRVNGDHEFIELTEMGLFEKTEPFSISLWLKPEKKVQYQEIFGNNGNKNSYWRGYESYLDSLNRVTWRLVHALPHNLIQVTTEEGIPASEWTHLTFAYDGSSSASGLKIYVNGKAIQLNIDYDNLYKTILPVNPSYKTDNRPLRFGKAYRAFSGDDGVLAGAFDEIKIYNRAITALEAASMYRHYQPQAQFKLSKKDTLDFWLSQQKEYKELMAKAQKTWEKELEVMDSLPELMIMKEMDKPRPAYILDRGIYNARLEEVGPATPNAVLSFADEFEKNRLGLAKWLISDQNPLTSRVTVNRYWQMIFGKGIVGTSDDFGNQGDLPTHPELLDWLAVDFRENGWDLRRLIKMMVMSSTYRQASVADEEIREKDPGNLFLARGPKHRLQAEMIRDNALKAAGLLVKKVGGPSAKPYQPPGLWIEKGTFSKMLLTYEADKGDGLYRRSLYTFIKRTSPPPNMTIFDQQSRSFCVVKRQTTNTPLQALVLLNDPQFVEASRLVAERMQKEVNGDLEKKLDYGFKLLTSRSLKPEETAIFKQLYNEETRKYEENKAAADSLLSVGDYPADDSLDKVNTAALTVVASLMMNHDEAYMKR